MVISLWIAFFLGFVCKKVVGSYWLAKNHYFRDIDEGTQFGIINAFYDEWMRTFNDTHFRQLFPSPVNIWMRCVDRHIRGYFFIENLTKYGFVADMPTADLITDLKLYANGREVPFETWLGGGDFQFEVIDEMLDGRLPFEKQVIEISIGDWKHFTTYQLLHCVNSEPPVAFWDSKLREVTEFHKKNNKVHQMSNEMAYIVKNNPTQWNYVMHIDLNDYLFRGQKFNLHVVTGIANHYVYHRCVLNLTNYEVVLHSEQVHFFLENPIIARAAENGLFTFIIRNKVIPSPIYPADLGNCYWRAYVQNLAILAHWRSSVSTRLYLWDSDEFLVYTPGYTREAYFELIHTHPVVRFHRFMAFCSDCPLDDNPEAHHLSHHKYSYHLTEKLRDGKLVVDPNRSGCFIVHWSGCGAKTYKANHGKTVYIAHFENYYSKRYEDVNTTALQLEHENISPRMRATTQHCQVA